MIYRHGGDIYRNQVDYDFSVSINPLGMPLKAIEAAHEGIALSGRYPDYSGEKLKTGISVKTGVSPGKLVIGNGAAELIYALCHAVKPCAALIAAPTFSEYAAAVRASGGKAVYHYLSDDNGYAVDESFVNAIDGSFDIVFLCNPNNPTGRLVDDVIMDMIIKKCRDTGSILCVDESFLPFVRGNAAFTVMRGGIFEDKHTYDCPIVAIRSFTKMYGMPGLRLGYLASGSTELAERIKEQLQPWNTSVPAQNAGAAALADTEFVYKTLDMIEQERDFLCRGLRTKRIKKVYNSVTNYIMFLSDGDLYGELYGRGIMIRDCSDMEGLTTGFYRIGVRSHSENQVFLRTLYSLEKGE